MTITINNTNEKATFAVKNWNTGLNAVKGEPAVVNSDFPAISADNGAVKFRYWETEQFETVPAGESKTIADVTAGAEEAYYLAMNGVAGLEVTSSET